jgi:hypothetical protein
MIAVTIAARSDLATVTMTTITMTATVERSQLLRHHLKWATQWCISERQSREGSSPRCTGEEERI